MSRAGFNRARWARVYKQRMRAGLERCRWCGTAESLTLDHIRPVVRGGASSMANATILCEDCNKRKAGEVGWDTRSLWQEELDAKPDRRWSTVWVETEAVR